MAKPAAKASAKASSQLPNWFGGVSAAIKSHKKFRDFHQDASALAIELGAKRKNSEQFLKAVQQRRIETEETAVKLVEQSGFSVSNRGEKGYAEVMSEIEKHHGEHFKVISACWALEHGLQKTATNRSLSLAA